MVERRRPAFPHLATGGVAVKASLRAMSATTVQGLLLLGRPSAVPRRVWAFIVDAVERFALRSFSHVFEKVIEGQPTRADGDAAASVIAEPIAVRVETSLLHPRPGMVSRRKFSAAFRSRVPMPRPGERLFTMTSATDRVPAGQIVADDRGFGAAVASANPTGVRVLCTREPQSDQAAEALPSEITEGAHV